MSSQFQIQSAIYSSLSRQYGNASANVNAMVEGLYDGFLSVVYIDDPDVKMELLADVQRAYDEARLGSVNTLFSATRRLNAYILNSTSYSTINEFLQGEGLSVIQEWADLSAASGYPINSQYVD